ncbi:unnamed protein product [Arctia plantaginis]|uniref:Uncharacterized protein n=1 Tax=Arctia plantaginis TaxID=874455 RepID=A0A8S0YRL3_ARCPL|nr:unnamed protein product [Arctia plantaginis]
MVFLIFCKVTYVTSKNAGSAIFNSAKINLKCWNAEDIAKLQARKEFEKVIPPVVNPEKVDAQYIKRTLRYFRNALIVVQRDTDIRTAGVLKEALSDTIGAHLNAEILPTIRFAYYAGYIPYKSAKQAHIFLDQLKILMNTQGVGWKQPPRLPQWTNLTVAKIAIGAGKFRDPCATLFTKRDANNCIHVPTPVMDDEFEPSAMALPFRRRSLVSLTSPISENVLLKYYTTVSRCILNSSPANCRHADFITFNNELWHWMKRDVAPHLVDNKLYAAYSGILRIAAAVQNYGKGLSRRNLFEYHKPDECKWNPWRSLTQSYLQIDADWTPALYIALVISTAIAICLLQICYNYMFGKTNGCPCTTSPPRSYSRDIAYAKIDTSNYSAIVPQRSVVSSACCSNRIQPMRHSKSKTPSVGSTRTQRVYDLNENTEKLMTVIVSDNLESDTASTTSKGETDEYANKTETKTSESKPKSPPKIDTPIAQLTLDKPGKTDRSEKRLSKPMYSTSTLTRSDMTFCQQMRHSDSAWSATSSSTSGKSVTSTSTKSRSQRSRSSRDLAWARHVISRHSRRVTQSSGTELDGQSYTTPTTRR